MTEKEEGRGLWNDRKGTPTLTLPRQGGGKREGNVPSKGEGKEREMSRQREGMIKERCPP